MTSLLSRIDQELSISADPIRIAELRAERACYLARVGDFSGARKILVDLRELYGVGSHPRISPWVMLVEGVVLFYEGEKPAARDRVMRAHALMCSLGHKDMACLAAAWLAHIESTRCEYIEMGKAIRECLSSGANDVPAARLRIQLVLADANLYVGNFESARRLYEQARLNAVSAGDEAAIAAILHNQAVLTLDVLRIGSALGSVDPTAMQFLELQISSAYHFNLAAGHRSLIHVLETAGARLMLINGRFEEAASRMRVLLLDPFSVDNDPDQLVLRLEYAMCLFGIGSVGDAAVEFSRIDATAASTLTSDEALIFQDLYVRLGVKILGAEAMRPHMDVLSRRRQKCEEDLGRLKQILCEFACEFNS